MYRRFTLFATLKKNLHTIQIFSASGHLSSKFASLIRLRNGACYKRNANVNPAKYNLSPYVRTENVKYLHGLHANREGIEVKFLLIIHKQFQSVAGDRGLGPVGNEFVKLS